MPAAALPRDGTRFMTAAYRQPTANASIGKGGVATYNTSFSAVMQPICVPQDRKLLDRFSDKMRSFRYALATEKAYHH
jgi:hypothetical protein